MTDDRFKALREALAAGPTPGPWIARNAGVRVKHGAGEYKIADCTKPWLALGQPDHDTAAYIAAASPDVVGPLLDRVDELEAKNAALLAERDAAVEDAERYAFAKTLEGQVVTMETFKNLGAAYLDEALDAAAREAGR